MVMHFGYGVQLLSTDVVDVIDEVVDEYNPVLTQTDSGRFIYLFTGKVYDDTFYGFINMMSLPGLPTNFQIGVLLDAVLNNLEIESFSPEWYVVNDDR